MYKLLRPDGQAGTFTGLEICPCQGTDGPLSLFTRISWEAVSRHLSPLLIDAKSVAQKKKYQFVFFLTAGLGNDIKTTLSLINMICRDR